MQATENWTNQVAEPAASILTVGFGTTVAMWAVGYVGRLPAVMLPSPLLLLLLLGTLVLGGFVLGRSAGGGWREGAWSGALAGLLNLLILGSFLTSGGQERVAPSALAWLPLSLLISALLAAVGAKLAGQAGRPPRGPVNWPSAFVRVTFVATLLLLAVGGLVTSAEAGLAVVDWPNSFGYNMFLYPLSRMTGGIYYEHAHRLFGALVGLTTLIMALFLHRVDERAWVRRIAWTAFGMVLVQGVLGGLRVTGRFTLSTDEADMAPSIGLALVHGVFGQLFLATLVALAVFTSRVWRNPPAVLRRPGVASDRKLALVLFGVLVLQLALGASARHLQVLRLLHLATGVALVAPLAMLVGARTWGLNRGQRMLERLGLGLLVAVAVQILLGLAAYVVTGPMARRAIPSVLDLTIATTHQWFGAGILALVVTLACWSYRLIEDSGDQA